MFNDDKIRKMTSPITPQSHKMIRVMVMLMLFMFILPLSSAVGNSTNATYVAGTGEAIVYGGLNLILLVFLIGCFAVFLYFDNLTARVLSFGIGYLLLIAISFVAWQMSLDFITSVFLTEMFRIIFLVFMVGAFPVLIGAFAWYFIMLFQIKEIQKLMDKGIGEDEAKRRMKRR